MTADKILGIEHISKRYGDVVAVDDLTVDVSTGELRAGRAASDGGVDTMNGSCSWNRNWRWESSA